jgi:hypothetical protein
MTRIVLKLLLAALLFTVLLELACQGYAFVLGRQWARLRSQPDHFCRLSSDAILGYELKPGVVLHKDDRTLAINRFGIRDDSDSKFDGVRKVAVLGDSVVFSTGFSQEETIPALLQSELDPTTNRTRVLNFGVPGYNLSELVEQLKVKDAAYHVDDVIYLMNPNDFCRRNTMFEGADNGLYRMYCPPRFKSVWFARKLIYRLHKGDPVTPGWYLWVYAGEANAGFRDLETMADYCASAKKGFTVVLLPAGCAYEGKTYALDNMYDEIASWLKQREIAFTNPVAAFGESPRTLFTSTDHLTIQGNRLMAGVIAAQFKSVGKRR